MWITIEDVTNISKLWLTIGDVTIIWNLWLTKGDVLNTSKLGVTIGMWLRDWRYMSTYKIGHWNTTYLLGHNIIKFSPSPHVEFCQLIFSIQTIIAKSFFDGFIKNRWPKCRVFQGASILFLRDQIGQTVQKLWPLKDRWARKKSVKIWKISFLFTIFGT